LGLENLATMCVRCHSIKTARQNRVGRARKLARRPGEDWDRYRARVLGFGISQTSEDS